MFASMLWRIALLVGRSLVEAAWGMPRYCLLVGFGLLLDTVRLPVVLVRLVIWDHISTS